MEFVEHSQLREVPVVSPGFIVSIRNMFVCLVAKTNGDGTLFDGWLWCRDMGSTMFFPAESPYVRNLCIEKETRLINFTNSIPGSEMGGLPALVLDLCTAAMQVISWACCLNQVAALDWNHCQSTADNFPLLVDAIRRDGNYVLLSSNAREPPSVFGDLSGVFNPATYAGLPCGFEKLRIAEVDTGGRGIVASQFIVPGEFVTPYSGVIWSVGEWRAEDRKNISMINSFALYDWPSYAMDVGRDLKSCVTMDAKHVGSLGRLASSICNDGNCEAINVIMVQSGSVGPLSSRKTLWAGLMLVAKRPIYEGEEITIDYCKEYWLGQRRVCLCSSDLCCCRGTVRYAGNKLVWEMNPRATPPSKCLRKVDLTPYLDYLGGVTVGQELRAIVSGFHKLAVFAVHAPNEPYAELYRGPRL